MANLFVSYSRRDKDLVDGVVRQLEAAGHDVWLDRDDMVGGDQWRRQIVDGIEKADAFVFMVSSHSFASDNCRKEVDIAEGARTRLVPVDIETPNLPMPPQVKYQLAGLQRIDLVTNPGKGVQDLLGVLAKLEAKAQPGAAQPSTAAAAPKRSKIKAATIARIAGAVVMALVPVVLFMTRPAQLVEIELSGKNLMFMLPPSPDETELLQGRALDAHHIGAQGFDRFDLTAAVAGSDQFLDYTVVPFNVDKADLEFSASNAPLSLISLTYAGEHSSALEAAAGEKNITLRFSNEEQDSTWTVAAQISLPETFVVNSFTCQLQSSQAEAGTPELQQLEFTSAVFQPDVFLTDGGQQLAVSMSDDSLQQRTILAEQPVLAFQPERFDRDSREYVSTLASGALHFAARGDSNGTAIPASSLFDYEAKNLTLRELHFAGQQVVAKVAGVFKSLKFCQSGQCEEKIPNLLRTVTAFEFSYVVIGIYILAFIRLAFGEKAHQFITDLLDKNPFK